MSDINSILTISEAFGGSTMKINFEEVKNYFEDLGATNFIKKDSDKLTVYNFNLNGCVVIIEHYKSKDIYSFQIEDYTIEDELFNPRPVYPNYSYSKEGIDTIDILVKRILVTLLDIEKDRRKALKNTAIKDTLTITEASQIWNKEVSTLRRNFTKGISFKIGVDCRKSGNTWLVTRESMIRVYCEPKSE